MMLEWVRFPGKQEVTEGGGATRKEGGQEGGGKPPCEVDIS